MCAYMWAYVHGYMHMCVHVFVCVLCVCYMCVWCCLCFAGCLDEALKHNFPGSPLGLEVLPGATWSPGDGRAVEGPCQPLGEGPLVKGRKQAEGAGPSETQEAEWGELSTARVSRVLSGLARPPSPGRSRSQERLQTEGPSDSRAVGTGQARPWARASRALLTSYRGWRPARPVWLRGEHRPMI